MLFREDAKLLPLVPEGWDAPWVVHQVIEKVVADGKLHEADARHRLANLGVGASYSLLSSAPG